MERTRAEIIYEPESEEEIRKLPVSVHQTYLLHSKADRALRTLVAAELEGFKLTMMEWLLLGVISEGPEHGLSLSEIAANLDVSQPQVTALMTKVSKLRLVKQKIQRNDRRSRRVTLSSRGQQMLSQTESTITEKFNERLRKIPANQLKSYVDTISHISSQEA